MNERRELHESVQELDNLLEGLKKAQVIDERSYNKRVEQQSNFYNSTSSLNVPGGSARHHHQYTTSSNSNLAGSSTSLNRPSSSASDRPLQKVANSAVQKELDTYTARLESELNRNTSSSIPRGVFVKDVVEEEILVDHVLIQPKQQQSDKKFITRPSERKQGERAKRQVAFREHNLNPEEDSETYDNTDNEADSHVIQKRYHHHQQAHNQSNQSLNSIATDQSDNMTETSSILDPSKIINCYTCNERVVGQVITALGRNYHKEHFTCAHCNQELGTRNFYEKDNLPYCEKDYQSLFSPKCAACGDPILDVSSDSGNNSQYIYM